MTKSDNRKWWHRLFGIHPCVKCESWNTSYGYYSSGWNNYCNQASGDRGRLCTDCWHVEFDKPYEVRKAEKPHWITLHR
jgi:hypothetical protein